jgi:hypothetical protein
LTAADKAATAYKIITESSKAAIGDMARSSGSYANQMKLLRALINDTAADIGIALLPAATDMISSVNDWVKANDVLLKQEIPRVVGEIADNLGRIVGAIGDILKYAPLRGVMGTLIEGTELAKQGLIDYARFEKASFLERQRMVDQARAADELINRGLLDRIKYMEATVLEQENMVRVLQELDQVGRQGFDELNASIQDSKDRLIIATAAAKGFNESLDFDFVATNLDEMFALFDEQMKIRLESALDLEQTKQDITALENLWGQYYQSESERNQAWYSEQQDKYKDNARGLELIDSIYFAKKEELRLKDLEDEQLKIQAVKDMHDEQFLSEAERLTLWYEQQLELYTGHQESIAKIKEVYEARKTEIEKAELAKRTAWQAKAMNNLLIIASAFGKKGFRLQQGINIAQAIMSAHAGAASALKDVPYPYNLIAAAIVLAAGLAQVAQIAAQKPPSAHGGLDFVPKEQTFLLDRGERVVSPRQNRDLTEFIKSGGGGFSIGGDLILEIKAPSPIQDMSKDDWRDTTEDAIVPALRELKLLGIKA